mmetsp:Transcript_134840/g.349406  ORF Transcript_134840/g.349406 Transcript_134840/m.349406 type:complete len:206 (-) Transcript_134840:701-1318(-)
MFIFVTHAVIAHIVQLPQGALAIFLTHGIVAVLRAMIDEVVPGLGALRAIAPDLWSQIHNQKLLAFLIILILLTVHAGLLHNLWCVSNALAIVVRVFTSTHLVEGPVTRAFALADLGACCRKEFDVLLLVFVKVSLAVGASVHHAVQEAHADVGEAVQRVAKTGLVGEAEKRQALQLSLGVERAGRAEVFALARLVGAERAPLAE